MNPSQIIFRTVSETDGPAVIDLRRRVDDLPVPEKISTDFWWWENHQNPYGSSIAVVAVSDKKFVSHMSALPRQVIIKARPYPCSHLVEAMTDRALRRSMVFLRVGYKLERLLKEQKRALFYCFPNRNSRLIFQRGFKWTDIRNPRVWLYPLRPGRVLRSRPGAIASFLAPLAPLGGLLYRTVFRFKPSGRVEQAEKFDARFQPLLDEIHSRHHIILERTLDYLNWRYCKAVARSYTVLYAPEVGSERVAGYLVFRRMLHEGVELGVILDLQVSENAANELTGLLLGTALTQMDGSGAHAALALLMPADPLSRLFRRSGFIPVPRKLNPTPPDFMIKLAGGELDPDLLSNPANWRLGFGDNDVF